MDVVGIVGDVGLTTQTGGSFSVLATSARQ